MSIDCGPRMKMKPTKGSDGRRHLFLSDVPGEETTRHRQSNVEAQERAAPLPPQEDTRGVDSDFQPSVNKRLIMELSTLSFLSETPLCELIPMFQHAHKPRSLSLWSNIDDESESPESYVYRQECARNAPKSDLGKNIKLP